MSDEKEHRKRTLKRVLVGICIFVIIVAFLVALFVFASAQGWVAAVHVA